ncbi:MAG: hypothetical protein R2865_15845 [Deinococcales bacterium]
MRAKFTTIIGLPLLLLGIILNLSVQNTWSPPLVITNPHSAFDGLFFGSFTLLAPWFFRLSLYVFKPLPARFFGQAGKVGVEFSLRHSLRNGVAPQLGGDRGEFSDCHWRFCGRGFVKISKTGYRSRWRACHCAFGGEFSRGFLEKC